jgi:hypothetical protein
MSCVRVSQILSNPSLHIRDFREWVFWRLLAGVELGKAHTKAELINIRVRYDVVGSCGNGWVDK